MSYEKQLNTLDIDLILNEEKREQVSLFKLLGVTLDDELSFDVHVDNLCKKLSQRIAVLSKISSVGNFKSGHISAIS